MYYVSAKQTCSIIFGQTEQETCLLTKNIGSVLLADTMMSFISKTGLFISLALSNALASEVSEQHRGQRPPRCNRYSNPVALVFYENTLSQLPSLDPAD